MAQLSRTHLLITACILTAGCSVRLNAKSKAQADSGAPEALLVESDGSLKWSGRPIKINDLIRNLKKHPPKNLRIEGAEDTAFEVISPVMETLASHGVLPKGSID
jgi:biopolymer transport protein ExbD